MKNRSFATLAIALALLTVGGSHPTSASAKAEDVVVAKLDVPAELSAPREISSARSESDRINFNPVALALAGLAVMGSLALRRAPNK